MKKDIDENGKASGYAWLTPLLKKRVRKVFEPRYKRKLTNLEIEEIAFNLVSYIEDYTKFKWRTLYGK